MEKVKKQIIMFRLHKWSDKDKLIRFIHGYNKYLVVMEKASRDHIQGVIIDECKKGKLTKSYVDEFRKKLKINQDVKGNKDFSVSAYEYDEEKQYDYFLKGDGKDKEPEIILNNILLESEVRLGHVRYWEKNTELKKTDGKKKWYKIRDYKLPQEIEEKYYREPRRLWYIKIVMYHDENDLLIPDDYQIKKMIKTYMIKEITDVKQKLRYIESLSKDFIERMCE